MKGLLVALACSLAASETPCYILYDLAAAEVTVASWPERERPVPVGSLVKPFVALAYGAGNQYRYPEIECRGDTDGCWWPRGHGRVRISEAIAHSCNAYFLSLAGAVSPAQTGTWASRFGLSPPPSDSGPRTLI